MSDTKEVPTTFDAWCRLRACAGKTVVECERETFEAGRDAFKTQVLAKLEHDRQCVLFDRERADVFVALIDQVRKMP